MSWVLVQLNDNWADEMDLDGFQIMDEEKWKISEERLRRSENYIEIYVGTNEEIDYRNGKDFLKSLTIISISDDQFDFIKKTFGKTWGIFPLNQALDSL